MAAVTGLLGLALLTAYLQSFSVPFLLDDEESIAANPSIRSLATAFFPPTGSGATVSGRPLLNFSLAVNHLIGGTDLTGYHVGNLLIHFAGTLFLFAIVRRTLRLPVFGETFHPHATRLAWFAAALWALHPMQTESVTYLIQRAESLVGLLYLATLYCFIRHVEHPSARWFILTSLACFLGMTAKEVMATAPLLLLLYDRCFVTGTFQAAWQSRRRLYLVLASSWLLLLALVLRSGGRGATVGYAEISWLDYALAQGPGIATYLSHALFPFNLLFDYGPVVEKRPLVLAAGCSLVLALLVAGLLLLRRRPRTGFLFAWFFLILAPTSTIIPVATQVLAEHRMYLPLASLAVGVVLALHWIAGRQATWFLASLLLAAGILTYQRNELYRSPLRLWEDTARKEPNNPRARMNYGALLLAEKRVEEAVTHLQAAVSLNPDSPVALSNLGQAFLESGRPDLALPSLEKVSRLQPDRPTHHSNLAEAYTKLGRHDEAEREYQSARRITPDDATLLVKHGALLRLLNRLPESLETLQLAVRRDPALATAHSNLGSTLLLAGEANAAIHAFTEALRLDPQLPNARFQIATALAGTGRAPEAIGHLEFLVRQGSPFPEAHYNLGILYTRVGRMNEALAQLQQTLALVPNHPQARKVLEMIRTGTPPQR